MNEQLAVSEIDLLLEALDTITGKKVQDNLMMDMFDAVLSSKDDPNYEARKAKREEKAKVIEEENKKLSEKIVLLKAKLILMKNKVVLN